MPLEERKYKDMNQFGEGEQAKICLDIMQKTGAHLELSLAKDQGLSIMVSGKLEAVMKARKKIVAQLQTQVSNLVLSSSDCVTFLKVWVLIKPNIDFSRPAHLCSASEVHGRSLE